MSMRDIPWLLMTLIALGLWLAIIYASLAHARTECQWHGRIYDCIDTETGRETTCQMRFGNIWTCEERNV